MVDSKDFFDAVRKGDAAKVKEYLSKDRTLVDAKNGRGFSAVTIAAYYGYEDMLKALLAHGPTMTVHEAALAGDVKRVRELVDEDPALLRSLSPDGFSPLGLAAHRGRTQVVTYLLSKGADVNYADPKNGFTALTGAVAGGHVAVVKLLVERGADVNHRYEEPKFSPLITAAAEGSMEIVELLLAKGADVNAKTTDGKTALSLAVQRGHGEVADLLRRRGAKADTRQAAGETP